MKRSVIFISALGNYFVVDHDSGTILSEPYSLKEKAIEEQERLDSLDKNAEAFLDNLDKSYEVKTEIYHAIPSQDEPAPEMVVYRYSFGNNFGLNGIIETHEGAQVIHVYGANIWMLVDTTKPLVRRKLSIIDTGVIIPKEDFGKHVGSISINGTVKHLFDCGVVV